MTNRFTLSLAALGLLAPAAVQGRPANQTPRRSTVQMAPAARTKAGAPKPAAKKAAPKTAAPKKAAPKPTAKPAARAPGLARLAITDYSLPNGLRVLLRRDTSAPVVSVCITYNVGSFVEPEGRTGFAHLFEHMLFQGSENVGKGEHTQLVVDNGGTQNGGTGQDLTLYYEQLPANQLEMALFLEGDRMAALDVSQENLDNQRAVVQEERRMRYDNQPYGTMRERLYAAAYTRSPYKHMPIGSLEDLNAADLDYVRQFYRTFYAPNNAVLAVVGDFEESRARALIEKYFGSIPRGPRPELPSLAEPPQTQERRVVYTDALAPLPLWRAGFHIPDGNHADSPALEVLAQIMAGGKSSRLWLSLVEKQQVVTSVGADGSAGRGPSLFNMSMSFGPGQTVEKGETALYAELERLKVGGVTEDEIKTARRQALLGAISTRRSTMDQAQDLSVNAVVFGDPHRTVNQLERIARVTPADVKRVANTYLTRANRTIIVAMPPAAAEQATSRGAQ